MTFKKQDILYLVSAESSKITGLQKLVFYTPSIRSSLVSKLNSVKTTDWAVSFG